MLDLLEVNNEGVRDGLSPSTTCGLFVKVDARTILPPQLADAANFLQHRILTNMAFYHKDENIHGSVHRFTALKTSYLNKVIPIRVWKKLIRHVQSIGLIERSCYIKGTKCFGYRIGDKFSSNPTLIVQPVGNLIRRKIMTTRKTRQEHRIRDKTYRHLLNWVGQIEIPISDWDEIKKLGYARHVAEDGVLSQAEYFEFVQNQLLVTRQGHYIFTVGNLGRIYSTVCSLVRPARSRITIQGQRLVEIDIKNSQPVFLTELLLAQFTAKPSKVLKTERTTTVNISNDLSAPSVKMQIISLERRVDGLIVEEKPDSEKSECPTTRIRNTQPDQSLLIIPPDVILWKELVENGTLYDHLMGLMGWNEDRRDEFKQNEIFSVLYGNPNRNQPWMDGDWKLHPASKLKPILAEHFPTVWAFLIFYHNHHGHGSLARELQRRESQLMIRGVCGTLAAKHPRVPVLTCHDAILTTPSNVALMKRLILAEFAKLGLKPTLKTSGAVATAVAT